MWVSSVTRSHPWLGDDLVRLPRQPIDARTKNLKNQHSFVTHVPASQVFDVPTC